MSSADFSSKAVKRNMTWGTGKLNLRTAEQERVRLTAAQQKQIQRLYENAAKEVAKKAEQAPRVPSDALRKQYLNQLQNQLNEQLNKIRGEVESTVKGNMKKTTEAVVGDNIDFLKGVGMPIQGAFSHVPDEVVRTVATGQLYEGKWSLSRALWKNTRRTQRDVQNVIAQGIAQNKSAYDIAKDLEKYVDPSARKDWDWSKVYPGTARKVDYSAQRLARTMVSHAYQQSFVKTTQKNPFVTKYKWVSSGGARTCEICAERDGVEYSKTDLPLDHPNGMCTFIAVIEDSMTDIADRIADWALGGSDPELDTWSKALYQGFEPESKTFQGSQPNYSDWVEKSSTLTHEDYDRLSQLTQATLSDKEKKAAKLYSIDSYEEMNKYLRLIGEGKTTEQAEMLSGIEDYQLLAVKRLTSGIQNSMLPEGLVLRRGTGWKELSQRLNIPSNELSNLSTSELNKLASGTVSETHGFLSTGFGYNSGLAGEVETIIYAPKGTNAISMQGLTGFEDEREVLLNSGTKIRILGVEKSDGHMGSSVRVFMEVIQ